MKNNSETNNHAVHVFDKRALLYQEKYMDVSLYAASLDLFCEQVKKNAAVLEIACGPGNMTQYVLKKRPDLQWLGTDLSPNMLELAKANNPTAEFRLMDALSVTSLQQTFDAILCGFVTPYLSAEENTAMIGDCYAALNPGGIFCISTIEGEPQRSGEQTNSAGDKVYMHYYREKEVQQMLEKKHFNLLHTFRIPFPLGGGSTEIHLVFVTQK